MAKTYTYKCPKASCKNIVTTGNPGVPACPMCGSLMMRQN